MRGAQCVLVLAVFLPGVFGALSSPMFVDGSGDLQTQLGVEMSTVPGGLQISGTMPNFVSESVVISNSDRSSVDLRGWTLTDGEGWLTFSRSRSLAPGQEIAICTNASIQSRLMSGSTSVEFGSSELTRRGRLALADDGDDITLLRPDGSIADRLCYGSVEPQAPGWRGPPVAKPGSGTMLIRLGDDTDTASDWTTFVPGREGFGPFEGVAYVEPFLCPEQMLDRLVREFRHAQFTICIAIYEIGDGAVGHELIDARQRGVDVRILVEGQPVGGVPENEVALLDSLNACGCDVRTVKALDGYRAYDYVHCKYAVIDSRRVVVTSENWMRTSLASNRGWGAVIEDPYIAGDCLTVFEHDFSLDRLDLAEYVQSEPFPSPPFASFEPSSSDGSVVEAPVTLLFSPEASVAPIMSLIKGASSRILIELMYLEPNMLTPDGLVEDILDAATRGVEVKVLLDGGYYLTEEGGDNHIAMDYLVGMAPLGSGLEVRFSTPYHDFGLIHNKGLVVDDTAIVSSINWGLGPFERNREAALMIESAEIADFYAAAFSDDWQSDLSVPSIVGVPPVVEMNAPGRLMIDAGNCSDPAGIASYEWDLGADGSVDWRGPICYLDIGSSTSVRLTVRDPFGNNASTDIRVTVAAAAPSVAEDGLLLVVPTAGAIGLWMLRKSIKSSRALARGHASQALSDEGPRSGVHARDKGAQRDLLNHRFHRHLKLLARRLHRAGAGHRHHRVCLRDHHVPRGGEDPHARHRRAVSHEGIGEHALPRVLSGVRREGHPQHQPRGSDQQPTGHKILPKRGIPDNRKDRRVLHERRGRL